MFYKFIVLSLFFLILSCQVESRTEPENEGSARQTEKEYAYMVGPLRERVRSEVLALKGEYKELIFISPGGLPSDALEIAEEIKKRQYKVVISQICLSACAEYILPVAKTLEFRYPADKENVPNPHAPLIGFHWNAMMIEYLMRENAKYDLEYCSFSDSKKLNELQRKSRVNNEFWKKVMVKLGRSDFTVDYRANECPWKIMKFENDFWFPTSKQLRNEYNLKFKGSVCADDYNSCTKVIDSLWPKGHRFVIGDRLYVSHGAN
jgi:hypothetical protein